MPNVIENLHRTITPEILTFVQDQDGTDDHKTGVLGIVYALLLVKFDDEQVKGRLALLDDDALTDGERVLGALVETDTVPVNGAGVSSILAQTLGAKFELPNDTVDMLIWTGLPLAYDELKKMAQQPDFADRLTSEQNRLAGELPAWVSAWLPSALVGVAGAEFAQASKDLESDKAVLEKELSNGTLDSQVAVLQASGDDPKLIANELDDLTSNEKCDEQKSADQPPSNEKSDEKTLTKKSDEDKKQGALQENTANTQKPDVGTLANAPSELAPNDDTSPKSTAVIPPKKRKKNQLWASVSPFLAGLILSVIAWLMLKSCQTHPTRLAVPSAMTEEQRLAKLAVPATVSLALDETGASVYALTGKVGNVGLGEEVKRAVVQVFGESKTLKVNVVSNTASKMPVSQYLPQLFGFMKGVPNASVVIDNKTIWLNASDPTALQKMIANIDVALPKEFVVEAEPAVDVVTKQASDQAKKALDALSIDTTDDDIIQALNAQLFVFKENSAEILPDSRTVLDKMASVLSAKALPLHIVVHTDNHGKSAQNKALSKSRAKAIKAYLVAKGVPAKQLTAHGVGDALPVASNATEQGRFKNSRVEFVLDDGTTPSMLVDNTVELSDVLPADDETELFESVENAPENTTNEEMLIDGESWYEKSLEQDIDEQEPVIPSVEPLDEAGEPVEVVE